MIVKITGPSGSFELIDRVKRCAFTRNSEGAFAQIVLDGDVAEEHAVFGSVYVLSDMGKTIDQFHK